MASIISDTAGAATTLTAAVETASGKLRGTRTGGVSIFKGIPYGADTGGAGRFRPGAPAARWTGVRDCSAYGPPAPQGILGGFGGTASDDFMKVIASVFGGSAGENARPGENCLCLNVYTPDASPGNKRPVMVWLHGGGFAVGTGGSDLYDGSALCRRGDVVVVTINHRLNALGYLYLGAHSPEFADSGNVGMLDIVLALQWVRDNAAAFGGDADNVTIFGESGGGAKASVLMAMPAARGLFHKAILQSGPLLTSVNKDDAAAIADRTLAALGIASADVHRLQTLEFSALIEAATKAQPATLRLGHGLAPVVDGRSLLRQPFDPDAPEISRDIPIIIGTNKDEGTLFLGGDPLFGKFTEQEARQRLGMMAPGRGEALYDAYRKLLPDEAPTYILTDAMTDMMMWANSITLAERKVDQGGAPVFMYRLDWNSPALGGQLRAPHGLDLPLMFDNVARAPGLVGTGPEPQRVADRMAQAWVNFAHSGDPSQRGLAWPAYGPQDRATMIFNVESAIDSDPDSARRLMWRHR